MGRRGRREVRASRTPRGAAAAAAAAAGDGSLGRHPAGIAGPTPDGLRRGGGGQPGAILVK
jgi:hypothetical protein